jgi:hypothetical protein
VKKALCVGINSYLNAPLKACINDADAVAALLEKHENGSPNFDVLIKHDIETKAELKSIITNLFNGDCDTALLYFSGHGFLNELGGYIVTPDYKRSDEGVSMYDILLLANQSRIKDKIIILDCCHSGAMGSSDLTRHTTPISEGISILTASKEDESAVEINGHGVFTNLLLEALKGGAADLRGHISPGSIYSFIDQALGAWDQRPVFKTNVSRFTSLREVTPLIPVETLRAIINFFPTPSDEFRLDPSFEDTNSPKVNHKIIVPYAKTENIAIFKQLQKLQSVGLVVPVDASFMYFAAMESKSCKLTPLGFHYWQLVKEKRI